MRKGQEEDPLEEVREMKSRASELFQHDVERYGAFLMEFQEQLAKRVPRVRNRSERPAA